MRKRNRAAFQWAVSVAVMLLTLALLSRLTHFRYENSDDSLLLKGFMGFEGGAPIRFSLYTHTLLAWLLHALGNALPAIPWFSLYQLLLLLTSCVCLFRDFLRLSVTDDRLPWRGALVGCGYLGVFAAFACCRVNYTTTAALAGAAASVRLLAVHARPFGAPSLLRDTLPPFLLLLGGYALRAAAVLPGLAFCALALCGAGLAQAPGQTRKRSLRTLSVTCLVIALGIGLLSSVRLLETAQPELSQSVAWHAARTALMDYTPFEAEPAPALAAAHSAGLSPAQVTLMGQWYFMDADITADALRQLRAAYPKASFLPRLADAVSALADFLRQNPRYLLALLLLAGLGLATLLTRPGDAAPTLPLLALAGLAGAAVLLLYLAYQGRLLPRGLDAVLYPAGALQAGLLLLSLSGDRRGRRARGLALALACALCLGLAGAHVLLTVQTLRERPDAVSLQREAELERFALRNPDKLIFRAPNLLRDTRLFPDVSQGVPPNLILWGDWYCRMPGWYDQLARYGVDGKAFTGADWLRENLLFATDGNSEPPGALLTLIGEAAGASVRPALFGREGTLRFYSFALTN